MLPKRRYFYSEVTDTDPRDPRLSPEYEIPRCTDTKIAFSYYKISGRSWINAPPDAVVFNAQKLVACTLVYAILSVVKNPSKRDHYTTLMAMHLSKFGVPRHEQPVVLEKIFGVIDVMDPRNHIIVLVGDVTVQLLQSASNLGVGIMHRWDLEKVTPESLEAAVRQMPCTICMDDLDHFDAAEEGNDHQRTISRLPCSHFYHEGCIALWLETNRVCPLCRSPAKKASKSSLWLHWPKVLVSVVGMLTVTLVPRLFNRRQGRKLSPLISCTMQY